jgi:hypothetical protein
MVGCVGETEAMALVHNGTGAGFFSSNSKSNNVDQLARENKALEMIIKKLISGVTNTVNFIIVFS